MLTLDTAITDESQVRVSYDQAGAGSLITDASDAENLLATVNNFNVVNGTADSTRADIASASTAGGTVVINFSEALDSDVVLTNTTFRCRGLNGWRSKLLHPFLRININSGDYTNNDSTVTLDVGPLRLMIHMIMFV